MNQRNEKTDVATQELWGRLFQASAIGNFLTENSEATILPSFSCYISELADARGEKPEQILNRSGIEKSFGHRLFTGTRNPSRDTVLQLAIGFGLSPEETQQMLKIAHAAILYPKVRRDAVIAFCLYHKMNLAQTQLALDEYHLPLLGGKRNGV